MKKYYIIFITILLPIFVFSQLITERSSSIQHKKINDYNTTRYYQILDGLNKNYVFWYRMRQNIDGNSNSNYQQYSERKFIWDSIIFSKSSKDFFFQDLKFIDWLLTFKKDNTYEHPIWKPLLDPYSSYIPGCLFSPSNSHMAIILIEIYLNGSGFGLWEYFSDNWEVSIKRRYRNVTKFVNVNRDKTIDEIRVLWKETNK